MNRRYLKKLQERKEKEQKQNEQPESKHEPEESVREIISTCSHLEMNGNDLVPFSVEDPVEIRRRRALEAAERRRNQN